MERLNVAHGDVRVRCKLSEDQYVDVPVDEVVANFQNTSAQNPLLIDFPDTEGKAACLSNVNVM